MVFVDADVEVHPDALGRIRARPGRRSRPDGGVRVLRRRARRTAAWSRRSATCCTTTSTTAAPARPRRSGPGSAPCDATRFLAVGGFDEERYPHPSIEDIELGRPPAAPPARGCARSDDPGHAPQALDAALDGVDRLRPPRRARGWRSRSARRRVSSALNCGWRHRLSARVLRSPPCSLRSLRSPRSWPSPASAALVGLNRGFYALLAAPARACCTAVGRRRPARPAPPGGGRRRPRRGHRRAGGGRPAPAWRRARRSSPRGRALVSATSALRLGLVGCGRLAEPATSRRSRWRTGGRARRRRRSRPQPARSASPAAPGDGGPAVRHARRRGRCSPPVPPSTPSSSPRPAAAHVADADARRGGGRAPCWSRSRRRPTRTGAARAGRARPGAVGRLQPPLRPRRPGRPRRGLPGTATLDLDLAIAYRRPELGRARRARRRAARPRPAPRRLGPLAHRQRGARRSTRAALEPDRAVARPRARPGHGPRSTPPPTACTAERIEVRDAPATVGSPATDAVGRAGRRGRARPACAARRPHPLVTSLAGQLDGVRPRRRGGRPTPDLGTAADGVAVMAVLDAARASAAAGGAPHLRPRPAEEPEPCSPSSSSTPPARPLLDRLLADGRLPDARRACGSGASGTTSTPRPPSSPPAPSTRSTAAWSSATTGSSTRSSGRPPSSGSTTWAHFDAPPPVWERLGRTGTRTLAVDPYESRPPVEPPPGRAGVRLAAARPGRAAASGTTPAGTHRRLERLFGAPADRSTRCSARHTVDEMLGLRRRLLGAPGRVADAAELLLGEDAFDLAWLTFCAAHVAGHQFWDLSQLDAGELDAAVEPGAGHARSTTSTSRSTPPSAASLGALPEGADLMVDLAGRHGREHQPGRPAARDAAARSSTRRDGRRRPEPAGVELDLEAAGRAAQRPAGQGGRRAAREGGARPHRPARAAGRRLEHAPGPSPTRPRTRATSASTCAGRERDGIVDPADADALMDEIAAGHRRPSATSTAARRRSRSSGCADRFGTGDRAHQLPDLIVQLGRHAGHPRSRRCAPSGSAPCAATASAAAGRATTPRATPGRSSCPARPATPRLSRPPRLEDVAATAAALAGERHRRHGRASRCSSR